MDGNAVTVLDVTMVRATFPDWRIGGSPGCWFAVRYGIEVSDGPRSLLRRYLSSPELEQLTEKLCLQEYLDGWTPRNWRPSTGT